MASAPQPNALPIFYNSLVPLSSSEHADWKARPIETAPFLAKQHAVPVTIDEFALAQRHYPIVFTSGPNPVPIALMGLNEGVNTVIDETGKPMREAYMPAYVRRYPFMLVRLNQQGEELSLCFDPSADAVGKFDEGEALFADGKPTQATQNILAFAEQFEQSVQRTGAFMKELLDAKILIDGEVSIQQEGNDKPFIYRGFQMVSEEKLRELRGDTVRKMVKSGVLPLIYAHLFSLSIMREIFGRQAAMGKLPTQPQAPAPVPAL